MVKQKSEDLWEELLTEPARLSQVQVEGKGRHFYLTVSFKDDQPGLRRDTQRRPIHGGEGYSAIRGRLGR